MNIQNQMDGGKLGKLGKLICPPIDSPFHITRTIISSLASMIDIADICYPTNLQKELSPVCANMRVQHQDVNN